MQTSCLEESLETVSVVYFYIMSVFYVMTLLVSNVMVIFCDVSVS